MSKATFALVLWLFPPRLPLYCQENLGTKSPRVHDKASDISPKNMAVLWKVATKWAKALSVTAVQVELCACTVSPKSTGRGRTAQAWAHLRAITSDTVCTQWCPQHSMWRGTVEHCQTSMYTSPSNPATARTVGQTVNTSSSQATTWSEQFQMMASFVFLEI